MGWLNFIFILSMVLTGTAGIMGSPLPDALKILGEALALHSLFMVSGFQISRVLNEKYPPGWNGLRLYLSNRILRVYPPWIFFLIMALVTGLVAEKFWSNPLLLGPVWQAARETEITAFILALFSNIIALGADWFSFLVFSPSGINWAGSVSEGTSMATLLVNPAGWLTGMLLAAYLIAPLLARRHFLFPLIAGTALLAWKYLPAHSTLPDAKFFPHEFGFFLAGMVSERLLKNVRLFQPPAILLAVFSVVLLLLCLCWNFIPLTPLALKEGIWLCMLWLSLPFLASREPESASGRFFRDFSVPFFLSHAWVAFAVREFSCADPEINLAISIGICVLLSAIVWLLLIRPLESVRRRNVAAGASTR